MWCRQQDGGHGSWNPHKECVTTHLQNHTTPKMDGAQAVIIRCMWVIVRMYYICARIVISTACMPSRGVYAWEPSHACVVYVCACVCQYCVYTQQGGVCAGTSYARMYIHTYDSSPASILPDT